MFDEQSPFLQRDNRRQRPALRLTAELLNRRHGLLLPGPVVAQRSVLDLGCALAATGRWVLDAGASSYVGVELQKEYADTAAELLSRESSAKIVCEDARAFASKSGCQYDVVVMIGLLHGLFDPLDLLQCAARVAREFVCIETQGDDIAGASMTPSRRMKEIPDGEKVREHARLRLEHRAVGAGGGHGAPRLRARHGSRGHRSRPLGRPVRAALQAGRILAAHGEPTPPTRCRGRPRPGPGARVPEPRDEANDGAIEQTPRDAGTAGGDHDAQGGGGARRRAGLRGLAHVHVRCLAL